jgi:hypothetical protein
VPFDVAIKSEGGTIKERKSGLVKEQDTAIIRKKKERREKIFIRNDYYKYRDISIKE